MVDLHGSKYGFKSLKSSVPHILYASCGHLTFSDKQQDPGPGSGSAFPSNKTISLRCFFVSRKKKKKKTDEALHLPSSMAGIFGFGSSSSAPMTMTVTNTPAADLAFTNFAYCSSSDLRNFSGSGSGSGASLSLALVGDSLVLSLRYPCSDWFHLCVFFLKSISISKPQFATFFEIVQGKFVYWNRIFCNLFGAF